MSLESKIFKGVSWVAFFSVFSQALSWVITVVIARILVPGDYGLMTMATILTGYALSMSELGLGNAVVQRLNVTEDQLSSVFWFIAGLTALLGAACFPLASLTAALMQEPRVIPLTQSVSVLFVLNGLQVVPSSLLRRDMDFKSIGFIDMVSVITASGSQLVMAKSGAGVWTLLLGYAVRSATRTVLLFWRTGWRPRVHFNFAESRAFLSFGITVALGRSLFYLQEKSDRFFAGRAWSSASLGHYSFALDLAQIPTDKIVSLINNVSFPAFSKLQDDPRAFGKLYLNIAKITAAVTLPLFMGGFVLGDSLVRLVLNPKWYPMIFVLRMLLLAQILTSMNALNNFVHAAQGRPRWGLYYYACSAVCMPVSFAFAARYGLDAIAVPWLTTYVVLCVVWIWLSVNKLGIGLPAYLGALSTPFGASALMSVVLYGASHYAIAAWGDSYRLAVVLVSGTLSVLVYAAYYWWFDRDYLLSLKTLAARGFA